MFMKEASSNELIRIDDVSELASPLESQVKGRRQTSQEEQDTTLFKKSNLMFPSGEALPKCWLDADYELP